MAPASQELQLRRAGVPRDHIYRDVGASGSTGTHERRGWHRLNGRLAGRDTLVVVAIDRIGRRWPDTIRSICELRDLGVKIRSLAETGVGIIGMDPPIYKKWRLRTANLHKWAVGHTFEFTFSLPEPANAGGRPASRKKRVGKPARKITPSSPTKKPAPKARHPKRCPEPTPSEVEAKRQERAEYDRRRNQTLERREHARLIAKEHRLKAKELGLCKSCTNSAILGQTRCPTCAENHRQSRRRSDAKRRAAAKAMPSAEE